MGNLTSPLVLLSVNSITPRRGDIMPISQILLGIFAFVLFIIFCTLLYAMFMAQCENLARLAVRVHDHTKGRKRSKR